MMPAAPVPLTKEHEIAGFACRIPSLDAWLKTRAFKNQMTGASRNECVGFEPSPLDPMTLIITMADLKACL